MPFEAAYLGARVEIPQARRVVKGTGEHALAVRREDDAINRGHVHLARIPRAWDCIARVYFRQEQGDTAQFLARVSVPQAGRLVRRAREYPLAVRREHG